MDELKPREFMVSTADLVRLCLDVNNGAIITELYVGEDGRLYEAVEKEPPSTA